MAKGFIATVCGTTVFLKTQRVRKTRGLAKAVLKALNLSEEFLVDCLSWLTPAVMTPEGRFMGGYLDDGSETIFIVELDK